MANNVSSLCLASPLVLAACIAACTPLKPSSSDSREGSVEGGAPGSDDDASIDAGGAPFEDVDGAGEVPDGGDEGGTDGGGEPMDMAEEPCSDAGALRCTGGGRQRCVDGRWSPTDACQSGQVCSAQPSTQGMCLDVAAVCKGGGGQAQCDEKGVLLECSAEGASKSAMDCTSARLCELGRETGKCATCVPGTHRCSDRALERCNDAGTGYTVVTTCDTAALCNASAGACTTATCLAGRFSCEGDMLRRCKADQSGWEPLTPCQPGLCDEVGGQCDVCTPGTKTCSMGASRACDAAGQGYTSTPCTGTTSACVGNGQCVQCDGDDDCSDPGACRTRHCDLGTGTCQPRLASARSACSGGLCNAQGQCVQCLNAATDCPAETNPCRMATCNGTCGTTNRTGSCTPAGGGSGVCSAGTCVQCASGSDCPSARPYCVSNQCRPCNGRCAVGATCSRADDCSSNVCTAGTCSPSCSGSCAIGASCAVNADCASRACHNGTCVACVTSSQCAKGQECRSNSCRTVVQNCTSDANCSGSNAHCSVGGAPGVCIDWCDPNSICIPFDSAWNTVCLYNFSLGNFTAGVPGCMLRCRNDGSCPNGYSCVTQMDALPPGTNSHQVCWPDDW